MIKLDSLAFVQARDFKSLPPGRVIREIVVHDMEAPQKGSTAEDVANYFTHPDYASSAHICADNNSAVRCVLDKDVAYAAPGCNKDGLHIELAGYGRQSREDWLNDFSYAMLSTVVAPLIAQWCIQYDIPAVHLTPAQLAAGQKGIVGHVDVNAAYHQSSHTDPGPNFPWDLLIQSVQASIEEIKGG